MHLQSSMRALQQALAVAVKSSKDQDPVVLRRARGIVSKLRGALGFLEGIGTMQPNWDMTDPDLIPEDQKKATQRRERPKPPPTVVEGDD